MQAGTGHLREMGGLMDHLQACGHCSKYLTYKVMEGVCSTYMDTSWVNRRGGCPMFPLRDLPEAIKKRVGQQKQKHQDRAYSGKNDRRGKFRRVISE